MKRYQLFRRGFLQRSCRFRGVSSLRLFAGRGVSCGEGPWGWAGRGRQRVASAAFEEADVQIQMAIRLRHSGKRNTDSDYPKVFAAEKALSDRRVPRRPGWLRPRPGSWTRLGRNKRLFHPREREDPERQAPFPAGQRKARTRPFRRGRVASWILASAKMTPSPEPVSLKRAGQRAGVELSRNVLDL